ncbi:cysteine-rich CWC family protein [Spirosoma flavus]
MNLKPEHEPTNCPRCGGSFACRADTIGLCQCQVVRLTEDQRQYVSSLFQGCLCANCLRALGSEYDCRVYKQNA